MSEPTVSAPVLVTCLRCGHEASAWIAVLWQHEHDCDGDVGIIKADALAILCLPCANGVQDALRAAVDSVTS